MSKKISYNYRQSVTGNANNVTLNDYVNCVCRQVCLRKVFDSVKLRYVLFANQLKHAENSGFMAENIVFCESAWRRVTGIVKILLSTVRTFATLLKCTNYAHRNFIKLQHVENTVLLSLRTALKIRVSAVRFCPRPPNRTVVLLCDTAVFLCPYRVLMLLSYFAQTMGDFEK